MAAGRAAASCPIRGLGKKNKAPSGIGALRLATAGRQKPKQMFTAAIAAERL